MDIVGPSNLVTLLKSIPPYWEPMKRVFAVRVGDLEKEEEFLKALDGAQKTSGVVVVMDTSGSTDGSATLAEGRSAIKALLPKLASGTQLAVVAAGSDALLAQKFTTDTFPARKLLATAIPERSTPFQLFGVRR